MRESVSEWDWPFLFYSLINVAFVGMGHLFGSLIKNEQTQLSTAQKTK